MPENILLVDDHMPSRVLGKKALNQVGFNVIDLADGINLVEKFHNHEPQIILLDVMLPDEDGFSLCRKIRKLPNGADIPIIMLTGLDDFESIEMAYEAGATDFITKPINWKILSHRIRYMVRANEEIKARQRSEQRIQYLAYYDTLTGLPNRQLFTQMIKDKLQMAKRYKRHVAILFLNIDQFKRVNESLGHTVGDELLQEIANLLRQTIRDTDYAGRLPNPAAEQQEGAVAARFGGDEFTLLLSELNDAHEATIICERIQKLFKEPLLIQAHELYITPSIGISVYPSDGENSETLLRNADTAMHFAKKNNQGQFSFYNETMNQNSHDRMLLENDLRQAVENEEFVFHFQPKISSSDLTLSGFEVLVRWQHPKEGVVAPDKFIGIAEETGLINPLGQQVLTAVCKQIKDWQAQNFDFKKIAVNISVIQLNNADFLAEIEALLASTGVPVDLIEFEITESVIMGNVEYSYLVLKKLHDLGIYISVDDFGTGYSSLSYLKQLPIQRLKIDRSFIMDLEQSEDSQAIAKAIISLAHSLGLVVTAEGVETKEQMQILQTMRCDELQGYYFSKPVPAKSVEEVCSKGNFGL